MAEGDVETVGQALGALKHLPKWFALIVIVFAWNGYGLYQDNKTHDDFEKKAADQFAKSDQHFADEDTKIEELAKQTGILSQQYKDFHDFYFKGK